MFNLLLNIQSTRSTKADIKSRGKEANTTLALKCGFTSIAELNASQVGPILDQIVRTRSYMSWNKSTKERFQFDTLVRNCE